MENVSSFVGVDAQNQTLNQGRVLISLKPLDEPQRVGASDHHPPPEPGNFAACLAFSSILAAGAGPDDRRQRSAARSTNSCSKAPTSERSRHHERQAGRKSSPPSRKLESVSSDTQAKGASAFIQVDRDTAGRLGMSVASVDNALYDAFGQRIVSTIFTQSNQYRVILEANRQDVQSIRRSRLARHLSAAPAAARHVPLRRHRHHQGDSPRRCWNSHFGQFPAATISFNLANRVFTGQRP